MIPPDLLPAICCLMHKCGENSGMIFLLSGFRVAGARTVFIYTTGSTMELRRGYEGEHTRRGYEGGAEGENHEDEYT